MHAKNICYGHLQILGMIKCGQDRRSILPKTDLLQAGTNLASPGMVAQHMLVYAGGQYRQGKSKRNNMCTGLSYVRLDRADSPFVEV